MFQYLRFWRLCPAAGQLVRFQLVFCPQNFKIYFETAFQNFQNKSPFTQRGEERVLGKFCDPLVSNYDICLIIQEHRLVDFFCIFRNLSKLIRSCKRYGLQIVRNGNISGVLVNSCIMRQSCKVSYTKLQLPQIVIAQPVANVKFFTPNCQYDSIHKDCNYKAYNSAVLTFYICIVWLKALIEWARSQEMLCCRLQTVQTAKTVQTAICWLQNFNCFIMRDTDKFIHDLSRNRLRQVSNFTVSCGYFQLQKK